MMRGDVLRADAFRQLPRRPPPPPLRPDEDQGGAMRLDQLGQPVIRPATTTCVTSPGSSSVFGISGGRGRARRAMPGVDDRAVGIAGVSPARRVR